MASGKFEDHSHEQLQKMVASGAPEKISTHAETLESAARIIAQASTYVNSVVSRLEWKGEAAQAYRTWATQFAKEGQKLSEYAQTVGTALNTAGQALNETKSGMPNAGSESAWREETAASPGAEVSREKARQEAIQRLERLDSYYSVASAQIRDTKEPTFKPVDSRSPFNPGPAPTSSPGGEGQATTAQSSSGAAPTTVGASTGRTDPQLASDRQVGTSLDSVAAPQATDGRGPTGVTSTPPQTQPPSTAPAGPVPPSPPPPATKPPTDTRGNPASTEVFSAK